jgi:hypothetical protein
MRYEPVDSRSDIEVPLWVHPKDLTRRPEILMEIGPTDCSRCLRALIEYGVAIQ